MITQRRANNSTCLLCHNYCIAVNISVGLYRNSELTDCAMYPRKTEIIMKVISNNYIKARGEAEGVGRERQTDR